MKIVPQSVELLSITPGAEALIEKAARCCYKSEDKICEGSAARLIRSCLDRDPPHESIIEHAQATFRIVCDRGISHEIVRHRIASFSQESTRYCNYGGEKFGGVALCPMLDGLTEAQVERRRRLYEDIEAVYLAETAEGVRPQQARDNLPTCLKTELVMTANFREWRHFLRLRASPAAHPQIREIAEKIRGILALWAPAVFGDR